MNTFFKLQDSKLAPDNFEDIKIALSRLDFAKFASTKSEPFQIKIVFLIRKIEK